MLNIATLRIIRKPQIMNGHARKKFYEEQQKIATAALKRELGR